MGNTSIPVKKRDVYLDLSALKTYTSYAATELRSALRKFANAHGVDALKTALAALNSAQTTPVVPSNSVVPTITGTKTVGQTLTGADGTWDNGYPATVTTTRQWYRSSDGVTYAAISGATAATYVLVAADQGKTIKFGVSKENASGKVEALSLATTAIS